MISCNGDVDRGGPGGVVHSSRLASEVVQVTIFLVDLSDCLSVWIYSLCIDAWIDISVT